MNPSNSTSPLQFSQQQAQILMSRALIFWAVGVNEDSFLRWTYLYFYNINNKGPHFFSAECKLFFFFYLTEKKNKRVFIKLDRVEREDREQTDIFVYRKALWEWNNVIWNSLIPCYGVCNVIVMACCWSVLLFSLSSLCFIFVLSTFQPGKFTILTACAFNARRELCSWDSYSCILSNSAWRGQLVLATSISGRSPFLILFLRWCKASPCSPFHIARRRVKMLAFPLLTFFFLIIFPQLQNAFGNEMPNFNSCSSCCHQNINKKQTQFTL